MEKDQKKFGDMTSGQLRPGAGSKKKRRVLRTEASRYNDHEQDAKDSAGFLKVLRVFQRTMKWRKVMEERGVQAANSGLETKKNPIERKLAPKNMKGGRKRVRCP